MFSISITVQFENVSTHAATKAMENLLDRMHGKRGGLFLMKRAQTFEIDARFGQLKVVADDLHDVGGGADFFGLGHRERQLSVVVSPVSRQLNVVQEINPALTRGPTPGSLFKNDSGSRVRGKFGRANRIPNFSINICRAGLQLEALPDPVIRYKLRTRKALAPRGSPSLKTLPRAAPAT